MKIRNGFVSNSSSSSFICDVCGTVECGYDASMSDFGMINCENGHTLHERCVQNLTIDYKLIITDFIKERENYSNKDYFKDVFEKFNEILKHEEITEEDKDIISEYTDEKYIPAYNCPVCNLNHINDDIKVKYITKKLNVDIDSEIRNQFKTLKEVEEYVRSK